MNRSTFALALIVCSTSACALAKRPPAQTIQGTWNSPLDGDLKIAADSFESTAQSHAWPLHLLWAGARGNDYEIYRGPTGQPENEWVPVLYVVQYTASGKCYLSYETYDQSSMTTMSRQHLGGGRYGPPRINSIDAVKSDEGRFEPSGDEILCGAAESVKGGVHLGARGARD